MWILIAVTGHLFNAVAFVIDKFLITKRVPRPEAYAFFISLLGALSAALLIFDPSLPSNGWHWFLDFLAGASFVIALVLFFRALKIGESSRVVPFIGGFVPLATFVFAYFLIEERLSEKEIVGFVMLVLAAIILASEKKKIFLSAKSPYPTAFFSSAFFALSFVLMKIVFQDQSFISGFVWTRLGAFLFAAFFLLSPALRRQIFYPDKRPSGKTGLLFVVGQVSGAFGFFLLQYAISLGSVILVNALQGLQYGFLFAATMVISMFWPRIIKESFSRAVVLQKVAGLVLVSLGLILIA